MRSFKTLSIITSSLLIAFSPINCLPAQAGAGDVLLGAAAGMAVGAMIAGSARPEYRGRVHHASHPAAHRNDRHAAPSHAAPSRAQATGGGDPFAGASHNPAPVTTPARYQ